MAIDGNRRPSAAIESTAVDGGRRQSGRRLSTTLKAWPVIAAATIGLCFLTQTVAGWLGIDLPDQQNVDIVRQHLAHAFDSARHFGNAAFLVAQVILLLPAVEEAIFRGLLVKGVRWLAVRIATAIDGNRPQSTAVDGNRRLSTAIDGSRALVVALAVISSALFSAAHYVAQPWPDSAFIALFFFGLAQCWLYRKTDRLWCAILNHGLFNLTNLVLLFVVPGGV